MCQQIQVCNTVFHGELVPCYVFSDRCFDIPKNSVLAPMEKEQCSAALPEDPASLVEKSRPGARVDG